jgi:hypothetical protein
MDIPSYRWTNADQRRGLLVHRSRAKVETGVFVDVIYWQRLVVNFVTHKLLPPDEAKLQGMSTIKLSMGHEASQTASTVIRQHHRYTYVPAAVCVATCS